MNDLNLSLKILWKNLRMIFFVIIFTIVLSYILNIIGYIIGYSFGEYSSLTFTIKRAAVNSGMMGFLTGVPFGYTCAISILIITTGYGMALMYGVSRRSFIKAVHIANLIISLVNALLYTIVIVVMSTKSENTLKQVLFGVDFSNIHFKNIIVIYLFLLLCAYIFISLLSFVGASFTKHGVIAGFGAIFMLLSIAMLTYYISDAYIFLGENCLLTFLTLIVISVLSTSLTYIQAKNMEYKN